MFQYILRPLPRSDTEIFEKHVCTRYSRMYSLLLLVTGACGVKWLDCTCDTWDREVATTKGGILNRLFLKRHSGNIEDSSEEPILGAHTFLWSTWNDMHKFRIGGFYEKMLIRFNFDSRQIWITEHLHHDQVHVVTHLKPDERNI
jgi:hypothetical protein